MQAHIPVPYIHHATCLPARSLQTTIVYPRQLMMKLSCDRDLLQ